MTMNKSFRVEFIGAFYSGELYDIRGREVFTLAEAAEAAEDVYGDGWSCVYNGSEAIDRESWLTLNCN